MYLIFALARLDVFPESDGAIMAAMHYAYGPGRRRHLEMAHRWRPYRSVACWYLYRHLDSKRGKER
jgi:DNA-3-methyladenine glycosylase II